MSNVETHFDLVDEAECVRIPGIGEDELHHRICRAVRGCS